MIRVAINGFGRIGRNTFKAGWGMKGIKFVGINDLTDTKNLAYLLKHDTVYGQWSRKVSHAKDSLVVDGQKIPAFMENDPSALPWKKLKVDVVLECTGFFRTRELASAHLKAGAKKVIISAPAKGEDINTYMQGVNVLNYKNEDIIDNASCTTNCIAPVAAIVEAAWGVKKAWMTTIHAYTADQKLVDAPHKDPRRGRTAAQNIIPTTTGAAIATTKAIPRLKGKFDGISIRVPVPVVSLADFTFILKKRATAEEVNAYLKKMTKHPLYKGILSVTEEPVVSSDFIGNAYSSIVDLNMTRVIDGDLLKLISWYDNEWGYSCRLAGMALEIGRGKK
ncbi:type I glyceraldehyde-3-phosphate dehydrogenase [Patescibacteria group bacterium]|nr:type I glyceraldehyde-3-phosphate dehydrogenase [Patescibacteria group bacterium]MBU1922345.1 type I glyceraldehyde-3-phosphate dehydrogenase [Patescibacteria group bacterium]